MKFNKIVCVGLASASAFTAVAPIVANADVSPASPSEKVIVPPASKDDGKANPSKEEDKSKETPSKDQGDKKEEKKDETVNPQVKVLKEISTTVGHKLDMGDILGSLTSVPDATYKIIQDGDFTKEGNTSVNVLITFKNGGKQVLNVPIAVYKNDKDKVVKEFYTVKPFKVYVGTSITKKNIRPFVTNLDKDDILTVGNIDTSKAGDFTTYITVTHKDKEYKVEVKYTVVERKITAKIDYDGYNKLMPKDEDKSKEEANKPVRFYIVGQNRVETSFKASDLLKSDTIVFASSKNFADSLSASNLVNAYGYKLVLVDENTDIKAICQDIKKAYIVGGLNSVSLDVQAKIEKYVPDTTRLAGSNRYKTNSEVLKISPFKEFVIADGRNYPDALSVTGLTHAKKLGLILTDGEGYELKSDGSIRYTIGGYNSVKHTYGIRISGSNRYETNKAINEVVKDDYKSITLVDGENFPDALSASNIVKAKDSTVVLVKNGDLKEALKGYKPMTEYVLGGLGVHKDNK